MRTFISTFLLFFFSLCSAQRLTNINDGETLKYRIHYGPLNAGFAEMKTKKVMYQGVPHLYVRGTGKTTGAVRAFFRVDDVYESFINTTTGQPTFYVRNVKEGSYSQHLQTYFKHDSGTLLLTDKKNPSAAPKTVRFPKDIQDMLSAFYYLRDTNASRIQKGSVINMNVWIDDELFPFQLRVVGEENIKTKFGVINCLKIIPLVKSGRVFKDKEGVTMWVSNDQNHIPISLKAELVVGSLKADIDGFSNLKYPLNKK